MLFPIFAQRNQAIIPMKKIIVPLDFTAVSETAVNHAQNLAIHTSSEVYLLHVIARESGREDAEKRVEAYREMASADYPGVVFHGMVRTGSIFDDIGNVASEIQANLIVMGTHGMRGMQFLVGSNALRIVSSSPIPIIIVQERRIRAEGYDDIVVPLDLHKETKQKLNLVLRMAKHFDSRVHLMSPRESDEFLQNKLDRNMAYARQFFEEHGVEYTTTISDAESGSDFADALIRFAASQETDLITIMNLQKNSLVNMIGGNYTQRIITNEAQIPVLLVNPMDTGNFDLFGWPAP